MEIKLYNPYRYAIYIKQRSGRKLWPVYLKEVQSVDIGSDGGNIATIPEIHAEMVMIAVPREEIGLTRNTDHQLHTEFLIEGQIALKVADIKVHMSKS